MKLGETMSIAQCKRCSKLFFKIKSPYCAACIDEIEERFKIIQNYMQDHPGAEIKKIVEDTGVEESILLYLLREDRLSLIKSSGLNCQNCGNTITSGRYCNSCKMRLTNDLTQMGNKISQEVKAERQQSMKKERLLNDSGIHIRRD